MKQATQTVYTYHFSNLFYYYGFGAPSLTLRSLLAASIKRIKEKRKNFNFDEEFDLNLMIDDIDEMNELIHAVEGKLIGNDSGGSEGGSHDWKQINHRVSGLIREINRHPDTLPTEEEEKKSIEMVQPNPIGKRKSIVQNHDYVAQCVIDRDMYNSMKTVSSSPELVANVGRSSAPGQ